PFWYASQKFFASIEERHRSGRSGRSAHFLASSGVMRSGARARMAAFRISTTVSMSESWARRSMTSVQRATVAIVARDVEVAEGTDALDSRLPITRPSLYPGLDYPEPG